MVKFSRPSRCFGEAPSSRGSLLRSSLRPNLATVALLLTPVSSSVLLDWSEWLGRPAVPTSERLDSTNTTRVSPTVHCLRSLVRECSLQLDFPGRLCIDHEIENDDFRVPFFYSGPSCGFEAPLTAETIEHLASKYVFRFVGDHTTQRLAESFVSIATGERTTHPIAHDRIQLSSGSLKVAFDFAPSCSGLNMGIGGAITKIIEDETKEESGGFRRTVIVTAFGVYDTETLLEVSQQENNSYVENLPQDVLQSEGLNAATVTACREATAQTVRVAAMENAFGSRPLVFLLQNNEFDSDSTEQSLLNEIRRAQREEIGFDEKKDEGGVKLSGCDGGSQFLPNGNSGGEDHDGDARHRVFLVENSKSLYGKLRCYQQEPGGSYYYEPVKLVEAKIIWDLITLVDLQNRNSAQPSERDFEGVVRDSAPGPESATSEGAEARIDPLGVDAVWSSLLEATSLRNVCRSPPCGKGKHIHTLWSDLGEEMSKVEGARVVRRLDLTSSPGMLAPVNSLDFVKTLGSYFDIFRRSLFPFRMMLEGGSLHQVQINERFLNAVVKGNSTAGRFLSAYYTEVEVPKPASEGYENPPTLVSMADVFISKRGYLWNSKDCIVPKSCKTDKFGPLATTALPRNAKSYEKVFVMNQHWGDGYFHFMVEDLPRITLMLDVLRENLDIAISLHAPAPKMVKRKTYMEQFLELLGIEKSRLIYVKTEIHADLAILPTSTPCGRPDAQMINMLRHHLLQAIYPTTGGIPHPPLGSRPVIVLIVRSTGRGLKNSDKVRDALRHEFPDYDVVEFFGSGRIETQLQTFATASIIVAPHGAGLSNMVVSPLHTPVLEIGPLECATCYLNLAVKLQHIYGRHPASTNWKQPCESKYEPNINEILSLVRELLEAKRLADAADPPRFTSTSL